MGESALDPENVFLFRGELAVRDVVSVVSSESIESSPMRVECAPAFLELGTRAVRAGRSEAPSR
jgi:hypothetical protein